MAGVVGGFLLTSSGIGRSARPVVLVAKLMLVAVTVAVMLSGLRAEVAVVVAAACWVGLIALEARVAPVEQEAVQDTAVHMGGRG